MNTTQRSTQHTQMYTSPLCKGTRIDADFCKGRFCIIIDSVKTITPSYILYNAIKYKNGVAKQVEIAELFIASCDKRGKDGKTRMIYKKTCNYRQLELPFIDFILKDSYPMPITQVCEFFGEEYGISEDYIRANATKYYVLSQKSKCSRCGSLYDESNKQCPYCQERRSERFNKLKRIIKRILGNR